MKETLLLACLPSLLLPSPSTLLLLSVLGFQCKLKSISSPEIPRDSSARLGLLRHAILGTEQLPDSLPIHHNAEIVGLPGAPLVSQSNKFPLIYVYIHINVYTYILILQSFR